MLTSTSAFSGPYTSVNSPSAASPTPSRLARAGTTYLAVTTTARAPAARTAAMASRAPGMSMVSGPASFA
jgi:hypothetical protein